MAERTGPNPRSVDERDELEFQYRPPNNLPDPKPEDGFVFRWIRTSLLGAADNRNVSTRMREGWVPVNSEDHPELKDVMNDRDGMFEGCIEIGGLVLCKASREAIEARTKYYDKRNADQIRSVEENFMRENDPRMPLLQPESRTEVTFGRGRPRGGQE